MLTSPTCVAYDHQAHMFTSVQTDQKGIMSIARTEKGRMVTITKDGALAFETQTLPGENPLLLTANDRVILAPTKRGSIITYSCPKTLPAPKKFDATQFSTEYKVHKVRIKLQCPACHCLPYQRLLC